ncbi:M16 family metallopeptidase [Vibrio fluvialis]|uniref:M16 family metallopeptidase n=1 Tax=Vibrio fluvialis TaxID=676 RepID=UPI001C9C51BA|nr:pitrilysin family protein [Vibrio fluvialis]MBY7804661.1 insulinase family protein [Vibrio fluvialis]MBY8106661.1 insulinase family protein [Vibrio fluvialis]MBY8182939.1 insulinase family protein [Vibrio fluvialis]MCE7594149.1 insulinase family protein [Vibrio fluvialis]MCG6357139.1 insulinase family protein [Vibrio fluvialis]
MRKLWFGAFSLIALYGCTSTTAPVSLFSSLPSGVSLVEKVDVQPGKVMIPYSKYRLDNGLTVILSPDHSDPLVHVDVTYHVGSAREVAGKSGFAHFFEHMMFQGSKHVGDQQHFRIITEAGGSLNGTTNRDRTNYYETVPSNQLEKVLWLESDRMGFLLDAVSQRKFEIQRDTVKNERAQNYDNRPYGLIWEKMSEAIYPEGHPYSWQTIGYVQDLDRVDVNDLKAFFLRWYGPNNAVLTIGGDIDVDKTLAWVSKYFGSIPKGPEVDNAPKQPASLPQDRFITLQDRIQQPMVVIGWPTAYRGAEDQASLDALAKVLGSGSNSLLYQNLVKTQKAVDAGAFQDCAELACTFYVYAMAPSGDKAQLKPLYHELMQTLQQFKQSGVDKARLDQINGMAEANAVFALESVQGKVTQLASNQTFYGQPDRIETQLAELRAVSPQSVSQVFNQYLDGQHKVTLSVVPKGQTQLAVQADNFTPPERVVPEYHKISDSDLHYRAVKDNFDRSLMPKVAEAVQAHMPPLYDIYFDNGAELLGTQTTETPTVLVEIKLPAGERHVVPGKEGLANLTAAMLEEGSTTRGVEQIQAQLDKLGSQVSVNANAYSTSIVISSLKKNLAETMNVVEEVLFKPGFRKEDFNRIKQQMIQGVVYQHQQPSWLASQATRQVLFGDSIFARASDGTEASIAALTLDDVKNFYRKYYTPHGAQIVVVGDIGKREVRKQLQFFANWHGEASPLLRPQVVPNLGGQKIYLVDKPGAPQTIVRLVRRGLPFDATGELYLSQLANFNLAGNFNSRINQNLREDKGYTYGASSYFVSNREVGGIVFNAQVRADSTVPSIIEMEKEMDRFSKQGMTNEEMKFLRLAVGQQDALSYETPSQKAQLLSSILTYSLDKDYLQQRNDIVKSVDKSTLDELAAKWFVPADYQIIVVGDAKSLKPQLEKLTIPVEELEIIR